LYALAAGLGRCHIPGMMDFPAGRKSVDPRRIDAWVFDLDNTLYRADSGLFGHVADRMTTYIAEHFGLDREEAARRRRQYFLDHGTTLRGLMNEHGLDPEPFLQYVHDIDLSTLAPVRGIADGLARLGGRKYVFTNACGDYALRILDRIGLRGAIDGIFDIRDAGYVPKPAPETYRRMIDSLRIDPARSVMVEDIARNLEPASALGMTTVWLRTDTPWGREPAPETGIDHVIDDLGHWINSLDTAGRAS
jgi:putative hydrolase of the HAD superfamily